ncbi:hypothetical protein L1887_56646 [Cichorium endivia]|nr:hypothetical protein L1887_56646 [Cichorium endivia]
MTSIVLSNVARSAQELPRRGPDRGHHVYPFYDGHLAHKYRSLVRPEQANQLSHESINTFDPTEMALSRCWTYAMVTDFAATAGQQKRWPFTHTTVLDCSSDYFPTDQGRLPVEDLGDEVVQAILQAADVGPAFPSAGSGAADPLAPVAGQVPSSAANALALAPLARQAPSSVVTAEPTPMDLDDPPAPPGPTPSAAAAAPPPRPPPTPTQPTPPSSQTLVNKPEMTNTRTAVYRIYAPTELKDRIRTFRRRTRLVKNEAVRLVNMATSPSHEHLNERRLYTLLANNGSAFSRKHPELLRCPVHARRQVILEAIAQRKSIITRYDNLPGGRRRPLPSICPPTKQTDKRFGFSVAFPNTTGKIEALYDVTGTEVTGLKLVMPAVTIGGTRYSEVRARICLRGERQRLRLLELCRWSRANAFKLPREWRVRCGADGRWYLHVSYELVDPKRFNADQQAEKKRRGITVLNGAIKVKSIDPGARTPFTVYTSEGETIEIGGQDDRARLRELRLAADRIQSRINEMKRLNRRPSSRVSREMRKRRFARPARERSELHKRWRRIMADSKNLVKEVHCRTAHFLALSSNIVVMPRMEVLGMVRRRRSRLKISTKRELLTWSHSAFVNRLAIKCHDIAYDARFPHKAGHPTLLLVQPEAYTSKTCPACGRLNDSLGSRTDFHCPHQNCTYTAGRDHNGAFNMIIKAIR